MVVFCIIEEFRPECQEFLRSLRNSEDMKPVLQEPPPVSVSDRFLFREFKMLNFSVKALLCGLLLKQKGVAYRCPASHAIVRKR